MTTTETVLIVIALVLIYLVVGNIVFSKLAERRNPPRGMFIDCDGVHLRTLSAAIRPLLAWCCFMAMDPCFRS